MTRTGGGGTAGAGPAGTARARTSGAGRPVFRNVFATFGKEGGRVGSGDLGSGQGGVGRCAG
ncbi:hypothetical protein [Streptomyces sp. I05A-00742]|uniref:hypothetical protein n=1 Tax=Streptomyces sp. I05A-00742 TaxID=2732853 RepID=UPI0014877840|nr:hypothetical protein [Streptomyces sp. I05A-00742]